MGFLFSSLHQWASRIHIHLPVQRFERSFGMGSVDAVQSAGGFFRAAVALFPVLEGVWADADGGTRHGSTVAGGVRSLISGK